MLQCFSGVGDNWFIETRGFVCFQKVFFYGETTQYVRLSGDISNLLLRLSKYFLILTLKNTNTT